MECGTTIGVATLVRRLSRIASDGCVALVVDALYFASGPLECAPAPLGISLAAAITDTYAIRTEPATDGEVTALTCDDADTLEQLLMRVVYPADGGGNLVYTWEDGEVHDCGISCDDRTSLEQMLRGAFVVQDNGVVRLRVVSVAADDALQCDDDEPWQTILRRAMAPIGGGLYAVTVVQQ